MNTLTNNAYDLPLVSIIMPVYNAEAFLDEAINSVFNQTYPNWELIVVNDGSTDNSLAIIERLQNEKVRFFTQPNAGVSAARNRAMSVMKGDYFCFLDGDDVLPPKSIEARIALFLNNESIAFVDGTVQYMNKPLTETIRIYKPNYEGNPLKQLLILSSKCFAGLTWMIKRRSVHIAMRENIRYGEDLLLFMELARDGGLYTYTTEVVLYYRQHENSAMKNLEALENGYWKIYEHIKDWDQFSFFAKGIYRLKVKKFMFLDYMKAAKLKNAMLVLLK